MENNNTDKIKESKISIKSYRTIRVATSAILIAVGLVLSYLNPFAYFTLFGTKINPFAHLINAISGVKVFIRDWYDSCFSWWYVRSFGCRAGIKIFMAQKNRESRNSCFF
ncbi:MAG: hypothetical protein ACTSQP_12910 [Promethearchaeota archaeon]